ncbi:putative cyclin-like f-box protein [Botrytis fragariae]|uniref:Putative cyclin-like f-box protein n=1 Tax=Botrytis fragariae TaxID=1964551 RepID=A0A8H6ELQ8_9HELO|nr:putative cyclin-like f-box protein [Botrytis fragariae]KAF5876858.1 putative cyclin-like f-box protein [Botrytis fragariae]
MIFTQDLLVFLFFTLLAPVNALPKKNAASSTTSTTKAATSGGITTASDGSMILDKTVQINGLPIRYKISAPANMFTSASGVTGGTASANTTGTAGLNVLLHGDGGTSFFDFPNQAVQNNLMGVVVLAPNKNMFWGGGSGLQRTDGVAHAAAVNSLIQTQLSKDVAFDNTNVFFTGVSGGSLLLSGFFMPAFGAQYKTGVLLNCGALTPQVAVVDPDTLVKNTKIHFQSSKDELTLLQPAIPDAVAAYEKLATAAGMTTDQIGSLQTVDNTPNGGGHCGFDNKAFVSGVQLMATNYANVMSANASGQVTGIGNVLKTVVGNEKLTFAKVGSIGHWCQRKKSLKRTQSSAKDAVAPIDSCCTQGNNDELEHQCGKLFLPFSRLPIELRLKIWKMSWESRNIGIVTRID